MSTRFSLVLALIFVLLQGTVLSPVVLEGFLVVLLILTKSYQMASIALFISGIVFDLIQNQPLGVTSLIFLFSGGIISYLSSTLPLNQPVLLASIVVLINTVRYLILFGKFELGGAVLLFVFAFILFWVLSRSNFASFIFVKRASSQIRIR